MKLAWDAENAGWDGFFLWDHVVFDTSFHPLADPWVALAAIATTTERMRIGTMITPVARRRPWNLARESVTLDRLCTGRLTLGVGLGSPSRVEFGFFGEETDDVTRARKLDEGLDILTGLWSGENFSYEGDHYHIEPVVFHPTPIQQPRIPIWVGGGWPTKAPFQRAARYDGVFPLKGGGKLTPQEISDVKSFVEAERERQGRAAGSFDYVASGITPSDSRSLAAAVVEPFAEAGATWWLETVDPWSEHRDWTLPLDDVAAAKMVERIHAGPPVGP
jgi:alkanesulfonate monooxygenase SsuD/methylene tetrahydromethanopterin reductase-like flavin-dependent oxidoreductase (luciferase family)